MDQIKESTIIVRSIFRRGVEEEIPKLNLSKLSVKKEEKNKTTSSSRASWLLLNIDKTLDSETTRLQESSDSKDILIQGQLKNLQDREAVKRTVVPVIKPSSVEKPPQRRREWQRSHPSSRGRQENLFIIKTMKNSQSSRAVGNRVALPVTSRNHDKSIKMCLEIPLSDQESSESDDEEFCTYVTASKNKLD